MKKLIFVLLDGLHFTAAESHMCYMRMLRETGRARFSCLRASLPPVSRPIYATLLTGKPPVEHGILRNEDISKISDSNIFSMLAKTGFRVATAAYSWILELFLGKPFVPCLHRFWQAPDGPIHNGLFYHCDAYPDAELFADAEYLWRHAKTDFLFVHSMGIDWAGHLYGGESPEYKRAVNAADSLLATYCPHWLEKGWTIIITSDHGMDAEGNHYSTENCVLNVPLWLIGTDLPDLEICTQTDFLRYVAQLFEIPQK